VVFPESDPFGSCNGYRLKRRQTFATSVEADKKGTVSRIQIFNRDMVCVIDTAGVIGGDCRPIYCELALAASS